MLADPIWVRPSIDFTAPLLFNSINSSEWSIFFLAGHIFASWVPKTSRLCYCLYPFNMETTALFPYVFIPFFSLKWNNCLLLPCSNFQSIFLLWVTWFGKTACQSWSHAIFPLYLGWGDQSPYLLLLSLVCLFLSPQMIYIFPLGLPVTISPLPPHQLLLHHYNQQNLILPQYLRLFFLPLSHCCHIHGHLYPPLQKYHHLWLSCLLTIPWRHILLSVNRGCLHC